MPAPRPRAGLKPAPTTKSTSAGAGFISYLRPRFRTPPWIPGFPGKTREGGGYRIGVRQDEGGDGAPAPHRSAGRRWRRCGVTLIAVVAGRSSRARPPRAPTRDAPTSGTVSGVVFVRKTGVVTGSESGKTREGIGRRPRIGVRGDDGGGAG